MTATIGPASTPAPGIAPAQPQDATVEAAAHEAAAGSDAAGGHPLAKLGMGDLHQFVQAFAPPGSGHDAPTLLAPFQAPPQGGPQGPQSGPGIPLYDTQKPGGPNAEVAVPKPKPPVDLALMEKMNTAVQKFDLRKAPGTDEKSHDDMRDAKGHFKAATDALKAATTRRPADHFKALGLPLPNRPSDWGLTARKAPPRSCWACA